MKLSKAMIFAAGFGTRLEHLVANTPKPLIKVGGKPLIDHALDIVNDAGIKECVVNLHYHAETLADHLKRRANVTPLHECPDILETGGGLLNATQILGMNPVFTMNSDIVWRGTNPLLQLAEHWHPDQMDALLLLVSPDSVIGHLNKRGDFALNDTGNTRRIELDDADGLIFTGAQVIHTACLKTINKSVFSLNEIWDQLIVQNRLSAIVYNGEIGDAGTINGLKACEAMLA